MPEVSERRQAAPQASTYADVIVELTQNTFRHLLPTILLGGLGLAGTTALLARHYHDRWLWLFTAVIAVLAAARGLIVISFQLGGAKKVSLQSAERWQLLNALAIFAFCCAMAACTLYSFRSHDSTAWTLCTLGTFMLCAGLSTRVGLHPRLLQASGLVMLLALALAVVSSPDPLARFGILLICLFAFAYYQSVQSKFDTVVDQIRSRRSLSLLPATDPLTGLASRHNFEATLATTCQMEAPFAILFIDIDRLSAVNAAQGRAVGDVLLQRVGVRLKNSIRRGDVVARIDGDEFAILQVQGASQQSAESLARRITRAVATPFEIDGHNVVITTTITIRLSTSDDKSPLDLFDKTHHARYAAPPPDPITAPRIRSSQF
jgi:diguanylate cyclase (GGDEF)-like protein